MSRVVLDVKEGDTWELLVQCRNSDTTAYDLTNKTAHLQLRHAAKGKLIADIDSIGGDILLNNPQNGDVLAIISSDYTKNLTSGEVTSVYADVELRSADLVPVVLTVASLELRVEPESTVRD